MKKIFTYGGKLTQRNLTVADIRKVKGVRKLSQTNPGTREEALAAVEAGVDMFICGEAQAEAVREGAPHTFLTVGISVAQYATEDDTQRTAVRLMAAGADAVYCPRRPEFVRKLTVEGISVMGHLGLVPRISTTFGGLRAVGKTADEAMELYDKFRRLEDAGAFAVEAEVVPAQVMREITKRVNLSTISLGSGRDADILYLFMVDIVGDNADPPRHAKAYGNLAALRQQMHTERVNAVTAFREDIDNGTFPDDAHSVSMKERELDDFLERLQKSDSFT